MNSRLYPLPASRPWEELIATPPKIASSIAGGRATQPQADSIPCHLASERTFAANSPSRVESDSFLHLLIGA